VNSNADAVAVTRRSRLDSRSRSGRPRQAIEAGGEEALLGSVDLAAELARLATDNGVVLAYEFLPPWPELDRARRREAR
jgi:hypothetical protein